MGPSFHDVKRSAALRACFSQRQPTVVEMKECELVLRWWPPRALRAHFCARCSELLPMQPPGDHQMQHQPEIFFKAETNALPETPQLNYLLTFNCRNRRCGGAQQKRRVQL